jgi:hypothetical protein
VPVAEIVTPSSDRWKPRAADTEIIATACYAASIELGNKR